LPALSKNDDIIAADNFWSYLAQLVVFDNFLTEIWLKYIRPFQRPEIAVIKYRG